MSEFRCPECGREGNTDDGISGPGDDCPDEDCAGLVEALDPKRWQATYLGVLGDATSAIQSALDTSKYPERVPLDLSYDELHVTLDALGELLDQIDRGEATPWEDYT